jgi:HK97 family phage prohead protease
MNLITRGFVSGLEIRSDGRTLAGIAVPFGTAARVRDGRGPAYDEQFAHGAFTRTIVERGDRVKLLIQHDRTTLPIGRATLLREDAAGLYGEFRVSATRAGDETLELLRDGALDGLSIGFRGITQTGDTRRGVTRTEVRLDEVSVVSFPAYDAARVSAVRTADAPRITIARRRLELARLAAAPFIRQEK